MSLGTLTASQFANQRPILVVFYDDANDSNLVSLVAERPELIALNLAQLISAGEIKSTALDALFEAGAVGETEIDTGAVTVTKIGAGAVTGIKLASVGSLLDGAAAAITVLERVFSDGTPQTLLAAHDAALGDRLIIVQAHVTEVLALTSYEWDVGSTADANGLFDDLFGGLMVGLRESEMSAYWLPAGEALVLTEVEQTDGATPTGKVTFRILDLGAVTTAKLAALSVTNAKIAEGTIGDSKLSSSLVKDTGRRAVGLVDFNATGDCTSVTVGTQVYTRATGAQDSPNGVWDEGANPAASATNLAAALNGDVRAGSVYAAVASDTTVFIFAKTAGTAGNVAVVRTGGVNPDVTENLVGGVAAAVKQTAVISHTVTAEEGTQVEAHIPLPFTPTTFIAQVRDSTGLIRNLVTDVFTIEAAPARIKVATGGIVHIVATDVIVILAQE